MVAGIGFQPKIPLVSNDTAGKYALTETYNENARQNVRMIVLTEQGEKLTDLDFGCGLRRFLFEQDSINLEEIQEQIVEQIETYAPYVDVTNVEVSYVNNQQTMNVKIKYVIIPTSTEEEDTIEVAA
jgi:phage baseplate assembly protein W